MATTATGAATGAATEVATGKAIVLCSDGTGNSAGKDRGTNVFRLYEALDLHGHERDRNESRQVAFYDDGVGTQSNPVERALGNAFGYGLARNVQELYTSLCGVWEPGDRIYLFGFSRGAYTARFLAALITTCGIVRIDHAACGKKSHEMLEKAVARTFDTFRGQFQRFRTKKGKLKACAKKMAASKQAAEKAGAPLAAPAPVALPMQKPIKVNGQPGWRWEATQIAFVGVWDTVDAYGFPWDWLADFVNFFIYPFRFPEFGLHEQIDRACHAIAIDDERRSFAPVLWDERDEDPAKGRLEQVWFAGVHSSVGGGYPKQGLALHSLCWMIERAEAAGLRFVESEKRYFHERRDAADKLYDSRAGLAVYYSYQPRDIGRLMGEVLPRDGKPKLHLSALERIALRADGYAPLGLPADLELVATPAPTDAQQQLLEAIRKEVAQSHGRQVLKQAPWAVGVRRYAHLVMCLATAALLIVAVSRHGWSWLSGAFTSPWASLKRLAAFVTAGEASVLGLVMAAILLAAWGAGYVARRCIEKAASQCWYSTSARLRKLLADYHAAGAQPPTPE